jgi:hypothetical protein
MTADDFRELALAMEGSVEGAHMKHPDFRANGRIFASIMPGETTGSVKLTPDEQRVLLKSHAATFAPAPGAWGRQGWTQVILAGADTTAVRGALLMAWQHVIESTPGRPRPRTRAGPKTRTRTKSSTPSTRPTRR